MTIKRHSHWRALTFALIALGVASGASMGCRSSNPRAELDKRLHEVFPDAARRMKFEETVAGRERVQDEYWAERERIIRRFFESNADYDAPSSELTGIVSEFDDAWNNYRDEVISTSLAMRESMTDAEWTELAAADMEALLAVPPRIRD